MFTVVVFHKQTKKIILALPFIFDIPTYVRQLDTIVHNDYDYRVYCDLEPVLYKDKDRDICLRDNAFIVNSKSLLGDNYRGRKDNGLDHTN